MNTLNGYDTTNADYAKNRWLTMETNIYFHSGELSSNLGSYIKPASIWIIAVPIKIWIPRQENKYTVIDCRNDIDDGIFDYKVYKK